MSFERPPAMVLVNMVTGEARTAQFNPTDFDEALGAVYAKHAVPGLSHQRKHFVHTEDVAYNVSLFYTAVMGDRSEMDALIEDRKFLYSLVHPARGATAIERAGAPRVLFVWPGFISLTVQVTKLAFKYTQFNKMAHPVAWTANLTLEEVRDSFVSMEDIRALGTLRDGGGL